ncbi:MULTISPECIES: group I truncated hemoglobin [unclassified Undibacterium]|uniref:group I truncated hemoglobin n=1 Tax=unclassified Undibacterium TaxID=2630295 RepID=UPI003C2E7535
MRRLHSVFCSAAIMLTIVLSSHSNTSMAQTASLYEELGGDAGISRIVDDTLLLVLQDPRIKAAFKDTNIKRLAGLLKEQFCEISGGPCRYSGDDMKLTHEGQNVSSAQFNALAEDIQLAMENLNISSSAQNKLIARLAPMKRDIVVRK